MTRHSPPRGGTAADTAAGDRPGTDAPTADCSAGTNPVDARLNERIERVSRWSALFVGALTVVLAQEIATLLPLGDTATALSMLPVSLALLYVLLTVAAHLERR